ncbi:cupin domain-containing protein [Caproiciproducens sp.]|uniref:cupin domain-containing protein n=1 Tax=Caproiciproducens sp. TaxID=1954376 RepID=UPI00289A28E6|nr:cupin domain-containing protein [Caproiciproducens sp.]
MEELNLGKKIQVIRTQARLSVRKAAAQAGITPSMLSQIENGQVNPSINTLRALAQVLDTPLYTFFQAESTQEVVVHPADRRTIGVKSEPDVLYELLTPDTKGSIEFCMMVIPPQMSSFRDIRSHEGEEVAFMQEGGEVELEMDGQRFLLQSGDSVRIPPHTGHAWHNNSDVTVKVIFAITPPSF